MVKSMLVLCHGRGYPLQLPLFVAGSLGIKPKDITYVDSDPSVKPDIVADLRSEDAWRLIAEARGLFDVVYLVNCPIYLSASVGFGDEFSLYANLVTKPGGLVVLGLDSAEYKRKHYAWYRKQFKIDGRMRRAFTDPFGFKYEGQWTLEMAMGIDELAVYRRYKTGVVNYDRELAPDLL